MPNALPAYVPVGTDGKGGVFLCGKSEEEHGTKLLRWAVGVVLGGVVALVVCLLVLLAASVGISRGIISEHATYRGYPGRMPAGRACGGRFLRPAGAAAGPLPRGLAVGGVLFLLLLTAGVLFFKRHFTGVLRGSGGLAVGAGLCGGGAAGAAGWRKAAGSQEKREENN